MLFRSRIGFKNAIVVQQQADDARFDTLDVGVASIRWMTNALPTFGAIGPSQVDPRSGEILDADIGIESLSSRNRRSEKLQLTGAPGAAEWAVLMQAPHPAASDEDACRVSDAVGEQLAYALDLLETRGEMAPDGPEAEAFVQDYLTSVTMHEVGHALGLRHNFRASRLLSDRELSDQIGRAHV